MQKFEGQVALISGGLGDIGAAIARQFAAGGADVALCGQRPATAAEPLLAEIHALGRRARYEPVDVADPAAVRAWVDSVEAEYGVASLIIPNAAIVTLKNVRELAPEEWQRELRVNLDGAFFLAQYGAQRLLHHNRPGRIVFVGSWAAHAPHGHIPAYCAAKAGMRMLMKCMAKEFAPHQILVNEVAPGYVDAGLSGRIFREQPEVRERAKASVPNQSLISSDEVAMHVLYLCDPENRQMTGSALVMDGGLSLLIATDMAGVETQREEQ